MKTQTHELYIGEHLLCTNSSKKDEEREDSTIKAETKSAPMLLQKDIMSYII